MEDEGTMEFDTVERDVAIGQSADYWRERSECLEEWVCELLMKNQALRMGPQNGYSQPRQPEETSPAFSLLTLYRSPSSSARPAFRTESPRLALDAGASSCPRKECAEVRKSVVENAAINVPVSEENN